MDPLVTVLVVLVVGAAVVWWLMRRRRPQPVEDEWTLPPDKPEQDAPAAPSGGPAPVQRLDRDALVNPNRTLDPSKWDNSPDGGGEEIEGDLPRFFDRDYLARKEQVPDDSATAGDGPAGADVPPQDPPHRRGVAWQRPTGWHRVSGRRARLPGTAQLWRAG